MPEFGQRRWAVAEGYIPGRSSSQDRAFVSHETACILNVSDRDAHVVLVGARRTRHVRCNDLDVPDPIPRDTDYASLIDSDVAIVVQHTRLDSRRAELALLTTTAYGER